jgi:hypothetical protein
MNASLAPQWKPQLASTFHDDGTVSYWSVFLQTWVREDARRITQNELSAMTLADRTRIFRIRQATVPR